jgi:(E)-4-hydroxy-3-methylbut-2-enyl-diphosphate synthase
MNNAHEEKRIIRRKTSQVAVGGVKIGGDAPISVQSMTNTKTNDVEKTLDQIGQLRDAGSDIIRLAVPDRDAAIALGDIVKRSPIPVVADIHFDHRLALMAIESGVHKLRINPGNIGSADRVREVVKAAKARSIPIRIGVNGGSLEKDILSKYSHPTPEALVESAMRHIGILEDLDFTDIVVALKTSDVINTLEAYRLLADRTDYPFHIGITESGTSFSGTIKSSIGVGALLLNGLGDTMRISLTGDPVKEVKVAREILKDLNLRSFGPRIVSCPTCGRCNLNLEEIALKVEEFASHSDKDVTIAVMGCAVNGPGEAREADFGIAGGVDEALLFRKGEIIRKVSRDDIIEALKDELDKV